MKLELQSADDLLRVAREQAEPDADEGTRVLRSVQARLSLASAAPSRASTSAAWRGLISRRQRSWGTATAAATIFAAGFFLGRISLERAAPSTPSAPEETPTPLPERTPLAAESPPSKLGVPATASAPPIVPPPIVPPPTVVPPPPAPRESPPALVAPAKSPAARVAPRGAAPPPPRASAPMTDTALLQQALQYLRRAQGALREREPMRALAIIDDLDRRVPAAVLMEERQMTRVLAHCQGGQTDDARQVARDLVAQHPDSVYVTRLRDACVPDVVVDALERAPRQP